MADDAMTAVAQHRHSDSAKLLGLLRGDLDWIVMKAIEKDRTRRYDTANAFAEDIQRHLTSEPVVARPPSQLYRLQKMLHRNKVVFAASALISIVLLLGVVVSTWQAIRATQAERTQNRLREDAEKARMDEATQRKRAEDSAELVAQALGQIEMRQASAKQTATTLAQRSLEAQITGLSVLRGGADFSLDGLKVVTISKDNRARIWDVRTGKPVGEPLKYAGVITFARFSPDGRQVLTASEDKTAQVWNVASSQPAIPPLVHSSGVNHAQFSPDGLQIATASEDQTARVWDARTGQPLTQPLQHGAPVKFTQFSRDGHQVATASEGKSVLVWNIASGQEVSPPLKHDDEVYSIQFSSDGEQLLTMSVNGDLHLWKIATGKEILGKTRDDQQPKNLRNRRRRIRSQSRIPFSVFQLHYVAVQRFSSIRLAFAHRRSWRHSVWGELSSAQQVSGANNEWTTH